MDHRLKKIERILAVQERLHQLAEWKLARLDREGAELKSGQESLVDALNKDETFHGLFVDAMARRLNALAKESERVSRAREAQSRRLSEEGLRLRRTERITERVRREYLKSLGKRGFEELLDLIAGKDDASLP